MNEAAADSDLERILEFLRNSRGFDFTGYKRSSLARRVGKRAGVVGAKNLSDYLDYLQVQPEEFTHLFDSILINVTSFFRDAPAWEYLRNDVLPRLVRAKAPDSPIRVWSAGCASGEEPYSLAICLAEMLGPETFSQRVKIYGTDVDEDALAQARHARYAEAALATVPSELRRKYFEAVQGYHVFRRDLRPAVVFGHLNVIEDAPISNLDLLVCRNTLMYFNFEAQSGILARFHFALNDTGFLFLGRAEMMLSRGHLFTPVDLKHRIFAKARPGRVGAPPPERQEEDREVSSEMRLRDTAVHGAPFAQMVVDVNDVIVLANEQVRALGLGTDCVGHPLRETELCYQPVALRPLIDQALAERRPVGVTNVTRKLSDGHSQHLDVQVTPVFDERRLPLGVSIVFSDVSRYARLQAEVERSTAELESAYEELQSTNEELQTTNEELQSTVEELETTNEELQSSNEEMETMNEELQSTNDELRATNDQLRGRTVQVEHLNTFLESILASMQSGVVVLDANLTVQSWNDKAQDLWGLRPEEVRGQPFFHLDIGLPLEPLRAAIRECQADGTARRPIVLDARNRRGKPIRCAVSCMPLTKADKSLAGVLVMMEQSS